MRYADIGEAHGDRLLSAVAATQVPDLARPFFSDHAREEGRTVTRIDGAHFGTDLPEDSLFRTDRKIADRGEHIAAADRITLHARNHGFRHIADGRVQFLHGQPYGATPVIIAVVRGLIAACAESAVASAGEHDATDLLVISGLVERLDQFVTGLAPKSVHLLRTVDNDPRHSIARLVNQIFEFHDFVFLRLMLPAVIVRSFRPAFWLPL